MALIFRDNHYLLQSLKIIFLHVDVKERTFRFFKHGTSCAAFFPVKNGGPDRTRTYDPRLIKAVL